MAQAATIQEAVSKAEETVTKAIEDVSGEESVEEVTEEITEEPSEEEEVEETEEEEVEETEEEEEVKEIELDNETKQAVELFKALKGENSGQVLQNLAAAANLQLVSKNTDEIKTKNEPSSLDIVNKYFGENYPFIAKPLASAINDILALKVDTKFASREEQTQVQAISVGVDNLAAKHGLNENNPEHVAIFTKMDELSKSLQHDGKMPISKYLDSLYILATNDTEVLSKTAKLRITKKIKKNSAERDISPSGVSTNVTKIKRPDKPSIKDAVAAAASGVEWQ